VRVIVAEVRRAIAAKWRSVIVAVRRVIAAEGRRGWKKGGEESHCGGAGSDCGELWQHSSVLTLTRRRRRRRRADVRAQASASLPDSLYTFYNIYV